MTFATVPLNAGGRIDGASARRSVSVKMRQARLRTSTRFTSWSRTTSRRTTCCLAPRRRSRAAVGRFVVGEADGVVVACAELAPLSAVGGARCDRSSSLSTCGAWASGG